MVILSVNGAEIVPAYYLGQCVARRQGLLDLMLQNAWLIIASSAARGAFWMLQPVSLVVIPF